jgi:hypothetical protein
VYHFAVVHWARFLPLFGQFLTPETLATLTDRVSRERMLVEDATAGTENHVVMQITSGVVLPDYLKTEQFAGMPVADARLKVKEWLRDYVRNLYHFGQGEWDSSSYLVFDVCGMLNIYDFSRDEECRLLARAALDWFATAYALKYVNGMHTGPKERGWTSGAVKSDSLGWLWWGSSAQVTEKDAGGRYAVHPYTSCYRPNAVITRLARRELPALPAEFRNSKPNYWTGLDKPSIPPLGNVSQESLYLARHYTLGCMWFSEDVCTNLTRMQLGAATKEGAVSFTGCAPGSFNGQPRYTSGQGSHITRPPGNYATEFIPNPPPPKTLAIYVQYAQVGPTLLCMAAFPEDAKEQFTYFTTPVKPEKVGEWYVMQTGETFIAVRPLTETAEEAVLDKLPALKVPGRRSGFILQTGDTTRYPTKDHFLKALAAAAPDLSGWREGMRVACRTLDGRQLTMQYAAGQPRAAVTIGGAPVSYDAWPVYDGPYVSQRDGVLAVNDGKEGFVVDFSGRLPVYRPWRGTRVETLVPPPRAP